jgi:hypothetical protein
LCVGEANKAAIAKQWQCYTSFFFRPGGKMSDKLLEQRIDIKFCEKLGKSASETVQTLTEAPTVTPSDTVTSNVLPTAPLAAAEFSYKAPKTVQMRWIGWNSKIHF